MEAQGLHVLREMRCGNSGSSTALSSSACPAARTRRGLAHHKVLIAQPLITGLVHEPAPRIEQLGPLDCDLVEDMLIGRLVPGLVCVFITAGPITKLFAGGIQYSVTGRRV